MNESEVVYIDKDRLRQLEELEAQLPRLIEEAVQNYKQNALKRLHEKDKQNPTSVAMRAKRYLEKNRDAINERRRLKRKLQRATTEPLEEPKPVTKIYDYTVPNARTVTFE